MSYAQSPVNMTTEEFLALPDDGVQRDLINGELREWSTPTCETLLFIELATKLN